MRRTVRPSSKTGAKKPTLETAIALQNVPDPAADAQGRRRRRHRRLARTIQAEFWPALRPPGSLGRPQRMPRENPTLPRALVDRTSPIQASLATPCLLLLDASPLPLDLVVRLWLLQYLPYKSRHKTQFTHPHPHTPGHPLASTYDKHAGSPLLGSRTLGTPRLKHHYIDQHIGHTQMKVGQ